MRHWIFLWPTR